MKSQMTRRICLIRGNFFRENTAYVFVADPDTGLASRREVLTGLEGTRYIEIRSGVDKGELIVTEGQQRLVEGTHIELVQSEGGPTSRQPGQDTITLINKAKAFMAAEARSAGWPPSFHYQVVGDESVLIWQDLKTIFNNGWQAPADRPYPPGSRLHPA